MQQLSVTVSEYSKLSKEDREQMKVYAVEEMTVLGIPVEGV